MSIVDRIREAPRAVSLIVGIGLAGWLFRIWAVLGYRPTCRTGEIGRAHV